MATDPFNFDHSGRDPYRSSRSSDNRSVRNGRASGSPARSSISQSSSSRSRRDDLERGQRCATPRASRPVSSRSGSSRSQNAAASSRQGASSVSRSRSTSRSGASSTRSQSQGTRRKSSSAGTASSSSRASQRGSASSTSRAHQRNSSASATRAGLRSSSAPNSRSRSRAASHQNSRQGSSITPSLWGGSDVNKTSARGKKHTKRADSSENIFLNVGRAVGSALLFLLSSIGRLLTTVFGALFNLVRGSRVALISCAVVLVLALGVGVDTCVNWGKAYAGVTVGGVDVSGMNSKQIKDALSTEFDQKMTDTSVTIFANEDARSYVNDAIAQAEDRAQAEQLSVDQARLNNQLWTTSPNELGGSIDYDNLAERAISVGRGDGGLFARLASQFKGHDVQVEIAFDETQVEHLAQQIDVEPGFHPLVAVYLLDSFRRS